MICKKSDGGITEEGTDDFIVLKGIEALEKLIKDAQLPTTFIELGYELTEDIAKIVSKKCGISSTGPKELKRDEVDKLLMRCQ